MSRQRSYAGQYAIVTGGVSGFGLALVRALVADGATVLAVDLAPEAPVGVLPEGALYRQLDVTDEVGWDELRNWVEATWGRLDLLVSNAGIAVGGRIDKTSLDDWNRIVDINLLGVVKGISAFVPMLKEQGSGQLVQTASLAGLIHAPGMSAYNTVKAAVVALSETLQHELATYGVTVSVICPSFFRTNLADSLQGKDVDLEKGAVSLINDSPRSADEVAAIAFEGMQRGKFLILTDRDGHVAYHAKRLARPVVNTLLNQAGTKMRKDKTGMAAADSLRSLQRGRRKEQ